MTARFVLVVLIGAAMASVSSAHNGRRFLVEVVDGKLQAQGVNTGPSDGAPAIRPYTNALHDHWRNVGGFATANLPGFDVTPSASVALAGYQLELELIGVSRWVAPPPMPSASTIPTFDPLAGGDRISIHGPAGSINSGDLGTLLLSSEVPFGGIADLDLIYEINSNPANEIHVLETVLSASSGAGTIAPSEPVYLLLSPDGSTPHERLHHASLFLEQYIVTVPEPTSLLLTTLTAVCFGARRRGYGTI